MAFGVLFVVWKFDGESDFLFYLRGEVDSWLSRMNIRICKT